MKDADTIISSQIIDDFVFIKLDEKYLDNHALNLTILECAGIATLEKMEKIESSIMIYLSRHKNEVTFELEHIRNAFVETLIENQVRLYCMNRFSAIRDSIFAAAFKPIDVEA